jgi:hypothetical protein
MSLPLPPSAIVRAKAREPSRPHETPARPALANARKEKTYQLPDELCRREARRAMIEAEKPEM